MPSYYNDNDPKIAQWLRNLVAAGLLPAGEVDGRSIAEVQPSDLAGYAQCHFFAGIGGWPLALQLAGWPPDRPVWTGSCPCQPFSSAGKRLGVTDKRHLWPHLRRLIAECRPSTVFGEQVDGAGGLEWLAGVHADLEALGFAFGAVGLPAASVGAPHIRQRFWWVANSSFGSGQQSLTSPDERALQREDGLNPARVADSKRGATDGGPGIDRLAEPDRDEYREEGQSGNGAATAVQGIHRAPVSSAWQPRRTGYDWWANARLVPCADGKARRISAEPGDVPLAHGVPARLVKLRAYGNAIVVPLAAEFIRAYLDTWTGKP